MPRAIHLVLAVLLLAVPLAASAQPATKPPTATVPPVTADQARRALETLQDDAKRAQLIDTLRAVANASPTQATPATPAPPPAETPAATPQLSADGLGAQLLLSVSEQLGDLSRDVADAARSITRFPLLWYWLERTATDPASYQLLMDIGWKLALVLGCALVAEWLIGRAVRRPLQWLESRVPVAHTVASPIMAGDAPAGGPVEAALIPPPRRRRVVLTRAWQSMIRLPFILGKLVLSLLPLVAFAAAASALLGSVVDQIATTRLAILAIVNAYVLSRGLIAISRTVVSAGPLSLMTVRDETAAYIDIWVWRITTVGAFGAALANVALLLGLYRAGYFALMRLVMLAVHLFVVVIILQCRRQIAQAIRPERNATGFLAALRERAAGLWHLLAIALVLALWTIWALNVRNGYALLLQYFVGTVAVVLVTRIVSILVLGAIDRVFRIHPDMMQRYPGLEARANLYLPVLRRIVAGVIAAIGFVALLEVWGVDAIVWFYGGQIGSRLISAVITIGIAVAAAVAVWEAVNAVLDRQLARLTREGHFVRAARLRTFMPMLRTALLCVIVTIVALTALSEVGVNVAPLLAGAGIIGIAIGFGSQKLVQDVITGLFLLLENVVQVGDTVTVSGLTGVVENLSIRTIRLRAGDGAVHIVPFSAVTSVTNNSRGVGNAAVNVSVAYGEDTDRAGEILKEIAAEMRREPKYQNLIRSDLDLWGVDKVDGAMATLVGQIPCTDGGRWPVQREFNRRMKRRFQEAGITIAQPNQTIVVQVGNRADADNDREARQPARRQAHA
ncbi:mechanosensitive ion channel [Bradyrhizobium sp. U87765 SZCCT0131]|uniref:mechanosensitive ion channel domain-containing protein n=1 Tax=unclassified Bradyrhizobium TaxID=2631580 RepID=UPI001BA98741|nr:MULTISPECIES: mechanosensitive ion channel domain-containing protein [unclassified Bradyrhizobium]MBR1222581.1 mechanosensitive ion channel [Bradyrhizobium sp. U87765 SZCCT0131]MBR1265338.1 mechanosensitive ion channel [Bradyrhizobium sp. U87765 SZCCT0134]MBR1302883.1 mechanosensitive ion channel [Bradyrhizobium sp. U87765 SZCCT0110]MBR1323581.1 mechanosensitive ion channel [Bradyrhizobium sp. U87765 SZCCT0109]MBR1346812.1 mechanosensitive ion channel [Bradyrhizobium sp. U87765 SZCCT0048]